MSYYSVDDPVTWTRNGNNPGSIPQVSQVVTTVLTTVKEESTVDKVSRTWGLGLGGGARWFRV